ncbi:unnamed protein product [Timema podura]|uniref:Uncharacterized protein n=1 Tax=Timema podura TaxID=61482 RepID=A0ABN7PBL9_TIMPD|nr:unnamed protein product [Timema podura]
MMGRSEARISVGLLSKNYSKT